MWIIIQRLTMVMFGVASVPERADSGEFGFVDATEVIARSPAPE
jgi:hypothetical protein